MLHVGDIAPDFSLPDQNGETVGLTGLQGKTVVLFFYPKADTPGCTTEACAFRDARQEFEGENAVLLGISPDESKAQLAFAEKFNLPFHLLADLGHKTAETYGVWAEKTNYGKKYMGIDRTTFVIAPDGKLRYIFRKVKVDGHSDEVLKAIRDAAETTEAQSEEVTGGK
jgi:peroxiredoxin Q/BCP